MSGTPPVDGIGFRRFGGMGSRVAGAVVFGAVALGAFEGGVVSVGVDVPAISVAASSGAKGAIDASSAGMTFNDP